MSVAGVYAPQVGAEVPVRMLISDVRQEASFSGLTAAQDAIVIEISGVQLLDVTPKEDDMIRRGDVYYKVRSAQKDDAGVFYRFDVDKVRP